MPRIPSLLASACSAFRIELDEPLPGSSCRAAASKAGAIILQGPHHGAQTSTRTGIEARAMWRPRTALHRHHVGGHRRETWRRPRIWPPLGLAPQERGSHRRSRDRRVIWSSVHGASLVYVADQSSIGAGVRSKIPASRDGAGRGRRPVLALTPRRRNASPGRERAGAALIKAFVREGQEDSGRTTTWPRPACGPRKSLSRVCGSGLSNEQKSCKLRRGRQAGASHSFLPQIVFACSRANASSPLHPLHRRGWRNCDSVVSGCRKFKGWLRHPRRSASVLSLRSLSGGCHGRATTISRGPRLAEWRNAAFIDAPDRGVRSST